MTKEWFVSQTLDMEGTLYRIARSQLKNRADQEDAVQEALRKAWEHRERLRNEAVFRSWLIRILLNVCRDMHRRRKDTAALEEAIEAGKEEMTEHPLLDALYALPPQERSLIVLHHVEGVGIAELSSALRIPQGTVKSRLARARRMLEKEYKEDLL